MWTDQIKQSIKEKKTVCKKIQQQNVEEEIRVKRTEYKLLNRMRKELTKERKVDEEFGIKPSRKLRKGGGVRDINVRLKERMECM